MIRAMKEKDKTLNIEELICDFTGGAVGHRFRAGGGRGQALPKAIGMKNNDNLKIVDATAGLGRDSFLLASLGAEVIMIERSAKIYKILKEGMEKAKHADHKISEVISRMTLLYGDAKTLLPQLKPEVILIDPMHPPRKNSALVKKEMRLIRQIVGTDDDSIELMKAALACASKRVVLKWPQKAEPMAGIPAPSHQILGKSTRYDVFMTSL